MNATGPSTTLFDGDGYESDGALREVLHTFKEADPSGARAAKVFRATFDQLYDGQRTGRFKWDQLFKTEKTHYGTLIEINLRREFEDILLDGEVLDYRVGSHEIDCKYSFRMGGWMVPPEAFDKLLLVTTADDARSEWAMGIVRATKGALRNSANRDGKTGLSQRGVHEIRWLHWGADLPPNVLLQVDDDILRRILAPRSGQQRINEMFRLITNRRIRRNTVATVARQDDYMKRVRANGGARSTLAREGFIIPGGDYESHRRVAEQLGAAVPESGEFVSLRIVPARNDEPNTVLLDGRLWRIGDESEWSGVQAPNLPTVRR